MAATRDPAPLLEQEVAEQASRLAGTLDAEGDPPVMNLLGWVHWRRHLALPEERNRADLEAAVDMFTACFVTDTGPLPDALLPILADQAAHLATDVLQRVLDSADPATLTVVIPLWRRVIATTPAGHPDHAARLNAMGIAMRLRYVNTRSAADLEEAIRWLREAVATGPADDPRHVMYVSNLGSALELRSQRTGDVGGLDEAVELGRKAVRATPEGHPDHAGRLSNLGSALLVRFDKTGVTADVEEAAELGRRAVAAAPVGNPERAMYLNNLGNAQWVRARASGSAADLDAAIGALREAVEASPDGDPGRAARLSNLGSALWLRSGRSGSGVDLEEAIRWLRAAMAAIPAGRTDRGICMNNLGNALVTRFWRTGETSDLDEAIDVARQAVRETPAGHADRAMFLSNLGSALQVRFERTGVLDDLDTAADMQREAVRATPEGHPDQARRLNNAGTALRVRFERTGALGDLEEAVRSLRDAVRATADNHPGRAGRANNLASALLVRAERTGAAGDVDEAIAFGRLAVHATPDAHPDRAGRLGNLGGALLVRFGRTGTAADLEEAVDAQRQAVRATPVGHPDRAMYLNSLGMMLQARAESTGAVADLDGAVDAARQAVQATPAGHPGLAMHHHNLGSALQARFQRTGALEDRDEAVSSYTRAAGITGATDVTTANVTTAIVTTAGVTTAGATDATGTTAAGATDAAGSADAAGVADVAGVLSAAPSVRILAAQAGASLCASSDPAHAAALLEKAVELLPQVAPRRLERSDRQYAIGALPGLAADAAALALSDPSEPPAGRATRALRLLEAARAVLLSQGLRTRDDLTALRERHPGPAARFTGLRDILDRPASPRFLLPEPPASPAARPAQPAPPPGQRERRHVAKEFADLLDHIRTLDGFGTFALPPTTEQLLSQATSGPVVVFSVSSHRSDALLLTGDGITALELPALTHDTLTSKITTFYEALRIATDRDTSSAGRAAAQQPILDVLSWLWEAAAGPVLTALGHHHPPRPGTPWPRVWWAPGGLLGLLPIHAAGHHSRQDDPRHRAVIDRVVSSYTPTVGALHHARRRTTTRTSPPHRGLVAATPTLEGAVTEAGKVLKALPGLTPLPAPTTATVLSHLPEAQVAHLACHGYSDPTDPSSSHLLLGDDRTDPLTVTALAPLALDQARLAYISACSTGVTTTTHLLDEAIHLASAFQLAGFPHVIATLWRVNSTLATLVATAFYTALTPDGTLDTAEAAFALHHTVRAIRAGDPTTPTAWASHIHTGA
ncbi:CHAT domain-containing protein [Sphaerisporangium rubeum]|uniref:CHAT domain-containing protein n=1 Tax=Sphaerisporangium rubeum TaxID=321317 RepID=A0A7X0M6G2_9ACTN|nr:hypothetical protein [Sphaerisporangium rubeum]